MKIPRTLKSKTQIGLGTSLPTHVKIALQVLQAILKFIKKRFVLARVSPNIVHTAKHKPNANSLGSGAELIRSNNFI